MSNFQETNIFNFFPLFILGWNYLGNKNLFSFEYLWTKHIHRFMNEVSFSVTGPGDSVNKHLFHLFPNLM